MDKLCSPDEVAFPDLKGVFDHAPLAVALFEGPESRLRYANPSYQCLLAEPAQLGESICNPVPCFEDTSLSQQFRDVLRSGKAISAQAFSSQRPGQTSQQRQRYDVHFSAWHNALGNIRGVLVMVTRPVAIDGTFAEAAAVDRRLRSMADAMPHAVFICDSTGVMRYVNARWKEFTGYGDDWPTRFWLHLVHPADLPDVQRCWRGAVEMRGVFDVHARLKEHASGQFRWNRLMACCYEEAETQDLIWVGTWTDVHDRTVAQLAQIAAQSQFIATLSHDLRNPLAGIRASVESMQRRAEAAAFEKKLARIVDVVDRADSMLESLLDIGRVTSRTDGTFPFSRHNLKDLLRHVAATHAANHGSRMQIQVPKDIEGSWHGGIVARAVDNLLANAFKYGDNKTAVVLRATHDEHWVHILVHNMGNPIPIEDHQRVFVPYARGSHSATKGWGLGLSMVAGVADVHRGTVELESDANCGTTFTLNLPKNPDEKPG